jgi:hypothetical protein
VPLSANTKELRDEVRQALADIATGKSLPGARAGSSLEVRVQAAAILLSDITTEEAMSS